MSILSEIADKTVIRIDDEKRRLPLSEIRKMAQGDVSENLISNRNLSLDPSDYAFAKALRKDKINFICEVKKASPSKGLIAPDFPYLKIAKEYEEAGAAAISCLTEPFWFKGADKYLEEIAANVSIPVLRKDFTVDEYMIYQAKLMGAGAILLICSILSKDQLDEYQSLAHSLGLSVLVEAHDEKEVQMALDTKARIIGVNNRNLKDFTVDIGNSVRLREMVPSDIVFVSESGMKTPSDIATLAGNGTNAVLIGETLMRADNKREKLMELASLVG